MDVWIVIQDDDNGCPKVQGVYAEPEAAHAFADSEASVEQWEVTPKAVHLRQTT